MLHNTTQERQAAEVVIRGRSNSIKPRSGDTSGNIIIAILAIIHEAVPMIS